MKYTYSKKADAKVEKDLEKVKKVLVEEFNPISIILFGGFGRGEGTFEEKNGKIIPLNDYDVYVVTKNKVSEEKLEAVGKKCSAMLGKGGGEFVEEWNEIYDKDEYFHVDLRWLGYNELKHLKKINRTYELKYGSTIIYGEDVRNLIPDIQVPLSEAFRYLTNPAGHLLLCMDKRRLNGKFKGDEKFYMLHHIAKSYLACASSLIISSGTFEPNYTDTVKTCKKLYGKKFPKLIKKIEWALKLKVSGKRPVVNLKKEWIEARDDVTFVLSYIAEKHLGVKSKNVVELTKGIYKKLPYVYFIPYMPLPKWLARFAFPAQYLLNLLYFKRSGHFPVLLGWKDVGIKIYMAAYLLLHAVDKPELLEEAYKYIKQFAKVKNKTWEELRLGLLYGFDRYYSQKLI